MVSSSSNPGTKIPEGYWVAWWKCILCHSWLTTVKKILSKIFYTIIVREVVQRREGQDEKKFFGAKCGLLSADYACPHGKIIMSWSPAPEKRSGFSSVATESTKKWCLSEENLCYRISWVNSNQISLLYITPEISKECRHQYWNTRLSGLCNRGGLLETSRISWTTDHYLCFPLPP